MKQVRRALSIAAAISVVLMLTVLFLSVLDICNDYETGGSDLSVQGTMYQKEDVLKRLSKIAFPLGVCILIVVADAVLSLSEKRKNEIMPLTPENRLRLIKKNAESLTEEAMREEKRRRRISLMFGAALILIALVGIMYLFSMRDFPMISEIKPEEMIGRILTGTAPVCALWILIFYLRSIALRRSINREINLLKGVQKEKTACKVEKEIKNLPVQIVFIGVSVLFIVLGVINGGLRDVLFKAINICTECIGLG